MADLKSFYGSHMMGREYGYRPAPWEWNPYTKKYHRGQDIRQISAFGNYSVTCDVLSLSAGRVVAHQRTGQLGLVVVVDTGRKRGRYEAHSHMAAPVPVGTYVNAGDRIARTAGHGEVTGSAWTAPHDHLTIGDSIDVAHNTWAHEYDPRPFIADALAQTAGGKHTPFNPKEDDMFDDDDDARLRRVEDKLDALMSDRAASGGVQVYERVGAGPQEWMVIDHTLPPLPDDPKQDGYRVTVDGTGARLWARQYSGADKIPVHVNRDEYIAAQEWARERAAEYRASQVALFREAIADRPS